MRAKVLTFERDKDAAQRQALLEQITRQIAEGRKQPLSLVLGRTVDDIRLLTAADGAAIALQDSWGVVCRASTGNAPPVGSRLRNSGLTRECYDTGRIIACSDTEHDPRIRPSLAKRLQVCSLVAVPLIRGTHVLGLIEVFSARVSAFQPEDVVQLREIADSLTTLVAPQIEPAPKRMLTWFLLVITSLLLLDVAIHRPWRISSKKAAIAKRSVVGPEPPNRPTQLLEPLAIEKPVSRATPSIVPLHPKAGSISLSMETALPQPPHLSGLTGHFVPPFPSSPAPILFRPSAVHFALEQSIHDHVGWITSLAFTPDGRELASAEWNHAITLREIPTTRKSHTLGGNIKEIEALALSRDGRWLAAENTSETVSLYDVDTEQEIRKLTSNKPIPILGSYWTYSIAFSPDSHWLATSTDDKTIRVWNVDTGKVVRDLTGSRRPIMYAAFSPDGHRIASGDNEKTIGIWDVLSGRLLRTLRGHGKAVYVVAFSPDGRWLASAGADKTIKIWNCESGEETQTLTGHKNIITTLAFSPDGRWLASGSWDKTIRIWDITAGRNVQTLIGHSHNIYTLAFEPDSKWLASGSEDGTINLWKNTRD